MKNKFGMINSHLLFLRVELFFQLSYGLKAKLKQLKYFDTS